MAFLHLKYPIIQAPMAGGPTTPELVAAVCNAGALGSLGAAYLTPAQIRTAIEKIRALTPHPFAVNLFTVDDAPLDGIDTRPALDTLAKYHAELSLPPPALPRRPAESFLEQAHVLLDLRVPIVSFTFGIPDPALLARFRAAGTFLIGTATTAHEATLLEQAGMHAVVAQGSEAGGHRGTFAHNHADAMIPVVALTRQCAAAVRIPIIASGGIMTGHDIPPLLAAGAVAVQPGTAFLLCPECGAATVHKNAVAAATADNTAITSAFSGRPARGIQNRFMRELATRPTAILPFPWQNALTRPLRNASTKINNPDFVSLWAGQNLHRARQMPAAKLIETLVHEAGLA